MELKLEHELAPSLLDGLVEIYDLNQHEQERLRLMLMILILVELVQIISQVQ